VTRRQFNGELLDITAAGLLLECSENTLRARVARRLVPFRKFSGRIVFRRVELERLIANLPGCSLEGTPSPTATPIFGFRNPFAKTAHANKANAMAEKTE
jgi:hypothetical protein